MLPGLTAEVLAENRMWMRQAKALDDQDVLMLAFQSYVVKTPHHTILIDSCIGNDKPRPNRPKWNMKTDDTYLRALNAAGVSVDDIDFVMCTHLHVDHVGWNTRLENGRWVPTFPKARYVFGKQEYDHWFAENAKTAIPPFVDSVLPVVEANRHELIGNDHQIGDHVRIVTTRCSPATSCTRRCRRSIRSCRSSSTSIQPRRQPRVGVSSSVIATPTRCAAPRISPRHQSGRSSARAMGSCVRRCNAAPHLNVMPGLVPGIHVFTIHP
jgi:ribonuclease BN (tRNA processing enzyme)